MRSHSHLLRPLLLILLATLFFRPLIAQSKSAYPTDSEEQYKALADAFRQNSFSIALVDQKLRGPGMDFISQKARTAQFVLFGEEHYVKEFPLFLSALFSYLHEKDGFNYLAVENDPVSAHVASIPPLRGSLDAIGRYAARYPNAFTFPSDQELAMFADAGRVSTGHADAVWGLDQAFGALHALDRLKDLSGFQRSPEFDKVLLEARTLDSRRIEGDETHYMGHLVKVSDLEAIRSKANAPEGSEAKFILDNLISSAQLYGYYWSGEGYKNGFGREQQMKQLFMREYRIAESWGERNPKVVLKLGHWHVFRGLGPSHLQTLGNFVTEMATANGQDAFSLGVYLRGPWRDIANSRQKGMNAIAMATDPSSWTVIDFAAVRPAVAAGKFGVLNPNLISAIYGFDAALVIGGASEGRQLILNKK